MISARSIPARWDQALGLAVAAGWLGTVGCWLLDVGVGVVPRVLAQVIVVATVVITAVGLVRIGIRLWRQGDAVTRWTTGRWLLLLVVMAVALHWIGIDWEVSGRYYRDEGIYYAAANDINAGQLLPESFIYGHLPYYAYALILWIQALLPGASAWLVDGLFGVSHPVDVSWVLLRGVNTTLGALTTIPVFVIGLMVAGQTAAVLGALLIVFSPIYNEITRLIISDVPSAFFAALCSMFVAFLLEDERYRPYLLAGAAAALAAASKYPAGVAAVGIVGVWLAWRIVRRRWSWHLLAAGAISLLVFLLAMPAFWAHSESVFVGQGKDLLFGVRQYGRGGWIGVMPSSNAVWYGEQLAGSFGLPVLGLALLGWPWLARAARRRWLWMLPFPAVFLALMVAMSMVVKRNLLPVVPTVAALLGAGLAGWLELARRHLTARHVRWVALVIAVALAIPVFRTTAQTVAFANDSTREAAVEWIETRVPRGAAIVKESYTPHVHKRKYTVHQTRFAPRLPMREMRSGKWDYLLLARNAYGRFLVPENWSKPHHELFAEAYREMLTFERVAAFEPSRLRMGPALEIFAIDPPEVDYLERYRFAFEATGFRYPRDDAYLLLKEYLAPGRYKVVLATEPAAVDGRIEVVTRDNRAAPEVAIIDSRGTVELPWRAKYFLYTYLPQDTELRAFELVPVSDVP